MGSRFKSVTQYDTVVSVNLFAKPKQRSLEFHYIPVFVLSRFRLRQAVEYFAFQRVFR